MHTDYYVFVKTGFETREHPAYYFFSILAPLGRFLIPFWIPSDFEGIPQIDHSLQNDLETNEKKEVQETALKTHELLIDF